MSDLDFKRSNGNPDLIRYGKYFWKYKMISSSGVLMREDVFYEYLEDLFQLASYRLIGWWERYYHRHPEKTKEPWMIVLTTTFHGGHEFIAEYNGEEDE